MPPQTIEFSGTQTPRKPVTEFELFIYLSLNQADILGLVTTSFGFCLSNIASAAMEKRDHYFKN